jgi:chromosome segregation ATPase
VKGVLKLEHKLVTTQLYEAQNKGEKNKVLLIEHPLRGDWNLVEPQKTIEKTATQYRFEIPVDAGKSNKLQVKEEKIQGEELAIISTDDDQMHFYSTDGEVPAAVRDALAKAAKLKAATVDTQRQIDQHNQQLDQITKEQNRIRDNLRTVAQKTDYYNRLLTKLNDQESQIEKLQGERNDLNAKLDHERGDLDNYLQNLNVQ